MSTEVIPIPEWVAEHGSVLLVDGQERNWPVRQIRPWLIEVDEPLKTKAPTPPRCKAYCCLYKTVIFYAFPYVVEPKINGCVRWYVKTGKKHLPSHCGPGSYFEYDCVEHEIGWYSEVLWCGQRWEMASGRCLWLGKRRRWVMRITLSKAR